MPGVLREYLDFMIETAYLAGRKTLAHFQTGIQADFKADRTPVTLADRAAEELIRGRIEARYPGHAILGEFSTSSHGGVGSRSTRRSLSKGARRTSRVRPRPSRKRLSKPVVVKHSLSSGENYLFLFGGKGRLYCAERTRTADRERHQQPREQHRVLQWQERKHLNIGFAH